MAQHVIHVKLTKGGITVSPDPLRMVSWDEVVWKVQDQGRLRIEFDGSSPFAGKALAHDQATAPNRPRDEAKGNYKYTVIDEGDPGNRLDPVIIIDPPPTQGHSGP